MAVEHSDAGSVGRGRERPGSQGLGRVRTFTQSVESDTIPPCQRHVANPADPNPGQGCVNPPVGANFYPIYTTHNSDEGCTWQLGGAHIPGTKKTFGGTSAAEYGGLLLLAYPAPGGPTLRFNNFRQVLSSNPC